MGRAPQQEIALLRAVGLSMTLAIAASAVLVASVPLLCATFAASRRDRGVVRKVLLRSDRQVGEALAQASVETALFPACGLVEGRMG